MNARTASLPIVPLRRRATDREEVQAIAQRIMERRQEPSVPRPPPANESPATKQR